MSRLTVRTIVASLLLVFAFAAVGAARKATAGPDSGSIDVKIDNFTFTPQTITVPAGTAVRWTNRDDIPHTSVSEDKTFKSKVLDTDDQFAYTFSKPGTYKYFCSIHPKMTGTVVVK
jgi:plastocyanin